MGDLKSQVPIIAPLSKVPLQDVTRWELVNECESLFELMLTTQLISDANGEIKGRQRMWNAIKQCEGMMAFMMDRSDSRVVTRSFGLRQQIIYIKESAKEYNDTH